MTPRVAAEDGGWAASALLELAPLLDESDLEWQDQALCAQTDPEAFFPDKGGSTREAKRVCRNCEVRAECLEYALEHDERFGVWGGFSERERRRLKRDAAGSAIADGDAAQDAAREAAAAHARDLGRANSARVAEAARSVRAGRRAALGLPELPVPQPREKVFA